MKNIKPWCTGSITNWDQGCIATAKNECDLNCSSVAPAEECSFLDPNLVASCPQCNHAISPVCSLGLETYCNECHAVCELSSQLVLEHPSFSKETLKAMAESYLTTGVCSGNCVESDPCFGVPGSSCIQVAGIASHPFVSSGDPRKFICAPVTMSGPVVECNLCDNKPEDFCAWGSWENPFINQCWASKCFGLEDHEITPGKCPSTKIFLSVGYFHSFEKKF